MSIISNLARSNIFGQMRRMMLSFWDENDPNSPINEIRSMQTAPEEEDEEEEE